MAGKQTKGKQTSRQKLTPKQKEMRAQAAAERARRKKEAKEHKQRVKQIFTVVVCVILVLALGIPTIALSVLGTGA